MPNSQTFSRLDAKVKIWGLKEMFHSFFYVHGQNRKQDTQFKILNFFFFFSFSYALIPKDQLLVTKTYGTDGWNDHKDRLGDIYLWSFYWHSCSKMYTLCNHKLTEIGSMDKKIGWQGWEVVNKNCFFIRWTLLVQ